jgi:hypothetical protein
MAKFKRRQAKLAVAERAARRAARRAFAAARGARLQRRLGRTSRNMPALLLA